jgi:hypothetical protein
MIAAAQREVDWQQWREQRTLETIKHGTKERGDSLRPIIRRQC